MTERTPEFQSLGNELALFIRDRDFDGAHSLLASWLRDEVTPVALQSQVEAELREVAEGFDIEELVYPDGHELSMGVLSFEDLHEPGPTNKNIDAALTAENFVAWMCVTFLCEDDSLDIDAWFDWWMAVVREEGRLAVGYYEITGAD